MAAAMMDGDETISRTKKTKHEVILHDLKGFIFPEKLVDNDEKTWSLEKPIGTTNK